jgi:hypothetical protein
MTCNGPAEKRRAAQYGTGGQASLEPSARELRTFGFRIRGANESYH